MYCSNCGSQLKETDIFCSKCGHKQSDQSKVEEPPREEVVFNTFSQKEKPVSFGDQEDSFSSYEKKHEKPFQAPEQSRQSVNNARRPVEDDFVWNVHQFPDAGPRETEDIDFRWDEEIKAQKEVFKGSSDKEMDERIDKSKFHTYNKSREEFQELLDKEYLRQNRDEDPTEKKLPEYPIFDPIDHVRNMEKQREETSSYYNEPDYYQQGSHKFDTVELQKDLMQPEIDETSKTQIIEKIKYGDQAYRSQEDDFDIKKTQFIQDDERRLRNSALDSTSEAASIPPVGSQDYSEDYIDQNLVKDSKPIITEDIPEVPRPEVPQWSIFAKTEKPLNVVSGNSEEETLEELEEPVIEEPEKVSLEEPEKVSLKEPEDRIERTEEEAVDMPIEPEPDVATVPGMEERLAKLWDSDTAPVPVASLPPQTAMVESEISEDERISSYDPMDDVYEEYDEKDGKRGGFFGKFIIAIIVIVLIIEGSILGLRNFAPESEVTAKANQVILTLQTWIEDTFFNKASE